MFKQTFKPNRSLTVITLLLAASIAMTACGGPATSETITDISWQWAALAETEPASQSLVPTPENYTLTLGSDGELRMRHGVGAVVLPVADGYGSFACQGSRVSRLIVYE